MTWRHIILKSSKISVEVNGISVSDIDIASARIDDKPAELKSVALCITDFSKYRIHTTYVFIF